MNDVLGLSFFLSGNVVAAPANLETFLSHTNFVSFHFASPISSTVMHQVNPVMLKQSWQSLSKRPA